MPYPVPADIEEYAEAHTTPQEPWLKALAEETQATLDLPFLMTGPLAGRFLEMLVFSLKARLVLEIGTFSGYGTLSMAAGLAPGGKVITCDINPKTVEVAKRHVAASPYADRIEFRLGPALDTIAELDGPFDFVFIDADKVSYLDYYEAVLPKLADGGLIAIDNVLWSGQVLDLEYDGRNTVALRKLNDAIVMDDRVVCVMTTVRDGITLVRKR